MDLSILTTLVVSAALAYPVVRLVLRRPALTVALLVGIVCFSSYVFALLYSAGAPAAVVRGLIPVKDCLALLVAGTMIVVRGRAQRGVVTLAAVLAVLGLIATLSSFLGGASADQVMFGLRGLMVAPLGLVIALLLPAGERLPAARLSSVLVGAAAVLALVEYVLPWSFVTDVVGVGRYWAEVKLQPQFLVKIPDTGLLPGNATVNPYVAGSDRRLMGPFGDPLAAGAVLAAGVVWAYSAWNRLPVRAALIGVSGVALLLTLTRAGWIVAAAIVFPAVAVAAYRATDGLSAARRWLHVGLRVGVALVGTSLAVLAIGPSRRYVQAQMLGQSSSTNGHLEALGDLTDKDYGSLGSGVGSQGATANAGTESTAATVVLQLGVVLGVAFLILTLVLLWQARRHWDPLLSFLGAFAAVLVTWAVSEQWLTFNAGFTTALLAGLGGGLMWRPPGRGPADDVEERDRSLAAEAAAKPI